MLLGSVVFIMVLFYLGASDRQGKAWLRKARSWSIISISVSVFSAALLCEGVCGILEHYAAYYFGPSSVLVVNLLHFFLWLIALQVFLHRTRSTVGTLPLTSATTSGDAYEKGKEEAELRVESGVVLLSHLVAFAAIFAFGALFWSFSEETNRVDLGDVTLAIIVAMVCLWMVFLLVDRARACAPGDAFQDMRDEHAEAVENDIYSCIVAWLSVQALCVCLTRVSLNPDVKEPMSTDHNYFQIGMLLAIGFFLPLFRASTFFLYYVPRGRLRRIVENFLTMCFAWCAYFSIRWLVWKIFPGRLSDSIHMLACALMTSLFVCVPIALFHILAKEASIDYETDIILRERIKTLGVMIGFSWEQAFHACVMKVSQLHLFHIPDVIARLIMVVIIVALLIPAWRWYILPRSHQSKKAGELMEDAECKAYVIHTPNQEPLLPKEKSIEHVEIQNDELKKGERGLQNAESRYEAMADEILSGVSFVRIHSECDAHYNSENTTISI